MGAIDDVTPEGCMRAIKRIKARDPELFIKATQPVKQRGVKVPWGTKAYLVAKDVWALEAVAAALRAGVRPPTRDFYRVTAILKQMSLI